jgi:hypothetical protein
MNLVMSKALSLFILLFSGIAYCQAQDKIYYDSHNKGADASNAAFYRIVPKSPEDTVRDYYMTGELERTSLAISIDRTDDKNTRWKGEKTYYYKNGKIKATEDFNLDGKHDGLSTLYYESGQVKSEYNFTNGVQDKFHKEYDIAGHSEQVFMDGFHNGNNTYNWPLNTNDRHDCKILQDSGLSMTTYTDIGVAQAINIPIETNKNYSIEAIVDFRSGDEDLWHGLIWGFKDWDNYYFFYISADRHYRIGQYTDGTIHIAAEKQYSKYINNGKDWNVLKVAVKKGNLSYYVNDSLIDEDRAYALKGTNVGFFIPDGKQQVVFEHLSVRQKIDGNEKLLPFASDKQTTTVETTVSDDVFQSLSSVEVIPSETDASIVNGNDPHLVMYYKKARQGKLLLFMTGTGGIASKGPADFFKTAIDQGYRLISLSYVDTPAVSQVCIDINLKRDSNCADEFRMKRIYGKTTSFSLINDNKQDGMVNRLVKLLQYLVIHDKDGNWDKYLDNGSPKWSEIAVSGQSQGGGMAEYMGKHENVYRVISFSGGWDWAAKGRIAHWYYTSNTTPPDAWFGTYNVYEPTADIIANSYNALAIPKGNIYALDLPVRDGKKAHVEGISNPAYKQKWIEMLGKGN